MRSKLLILTFLFLFFGVKPIFAAIEFNISNPQNNGDEIVIDVSISGLTSSSCLNGSCYLQAAFTSPSPVRYFGFTKNNNEQLYEYTNSPGSGYIQSTFFAFKPTNGGWSGQLTAKINPQNPNYKGPGEYNLKAWRYSGKSNSYSGDSDNTLSINIEGPATPTPTPSPTPSLTPNPTPSPTKAPSPTSTPKKTAIPTSAPPTPSPNPTLKNTPTSIPSSNKNAMNGFFPSETSYRIASVAAATTSATPSDKVEIKNEKQINPIVWIGLIFIFAGIGILGYIYSKNNAKIHIPFRK